jgi:leucyl/phenylalanyl-tRNA--protein transferase
MTVDPAILRELSPENLVLAYAHGAFPMVEGGRLYWFSPDPRGVLPLDEGFHVPRRLARTLRQGRFVCTIDRCFETVLDACADRPEGTWISPEIALAYRRLHEMGLAHSVEAWPAGAVGEGAPAGGLYGVALGGAWFGESMYHRVTDAGKAALVHSVRRLRRCGFVLYDLQWTTDNLRQYGAHDLPKADYLKRLAGALDLERRIS